MALGSFGGQDDAEQSGVGFVEISIVLETEDFSLELYHLAEFSYMLS